MNENSVIPAPTRDDRVSCLRALIHWIEREAETARGIRVVKAIAQHDVAALVRGQEPQPCDPDTICSFLRDDGDRLPEADAGDLVRNSKPEITLEKRRHRLEQAWDVGRLPWLPKVIRHTGGGRGNQTHYRLDFEPWVKAMTSAEPVPTTGSPDELAYVTRPAKPVWWLRWLFIPEGFPLAFRSWRGLAFLSILALTALSIGAVALSVFLALRQIRPVTAMDVLLLLMAAGAVAAVWPTLKALTNAPEQRVVDCPNLFLSMQELYGQLRCTRLPDSRMPVGWIALVRISSTCPRCGGNVELMPGRKDFPGRLVGRCRDAPSEHVFSFDPTTYQGQLIR